MLDAGHELRTPLTSLRTNLEVVRRLDELTPADREVLVDDVLTQMGELTNLVGDLSELARGEQRQATPAPLRLDQLVEDAVAVATTHGRSRDVRFTLWAEPIWVEGRRERIARAVGNLLDNALKWSPDGGVVEVLVRRGRGDRARPRAGHRPRRPAARLRPLLPGPGRPGPARLGSGAGHRGPGGRGRGRVGSAGERRRAAAPCVRLALPTGIGHSRRAGRSGSTTKL